MNVKEKDLVEKALGLAEQVGSRVAEMEGTLEEVDNSIISGFDYGKLIHGSYSVEAGKTDFNVLNVTGSGILYAVTVSSGTYMRQGERYAKITLDNFSFYLDCSEVDSDGDAFSVNYAGIMCPVSCLRLTRGMYTPGYYWRNYFYIFNNELSFSGYSTQETKYIFLPSESVSTPRRYILPPKPLAFDSNFKIDAFADSSLSSASLNIEVWYFLR